MDETIDRTLDAVGPRLKRLRLHRDITLADLAEETGISTSTLSRLEAGLRRPTLEQLLPLARAYGVTLDELVDAPPTGDPRINLRPIPCGDGSIILPLTRRSGGIQAYKFVLPAGSDERRTRPAHPRGLRLGLRPQRHAAPCPRRARPHPQARGGRRVRHAHPALVRGHRRRSRRVPQPHREARRTRARPRGTEIMARPSKKLRDLTRGSDLSPLTLALASPRNGVPMVTMKFSPDTRVRLSQISLKSRRSACPLFFRSHYRALGTSGDRGEKAISAGDVMPRSGSPAEG